MSTLSRWLAPAALAAGLGLAAMAPAPVQAQDNLTRVLVDIADVVFRSGDPYDRYGNYDNNDRLVVGRDRYGRPVYYRTDPNYSRDGRNGPPYGNAYGYYRNGAGSRNASSRNVKCNKHGKCKVEYYDPRYDRNGHDRDDDDHYRDNRRWRDDDDD